MRIFSNDASTIGITQTDAYYKTLLHLDGANAGTTFTDETGRHTFTAAGTAQTSTTSPKFGTASLLLDGNSDYIHCAEHVDFHFGTQLFTIDFWINVAQAHTGTFFAKYVGTTQYLVMYCTATKINFSMSPAQDTYFTLEVPFTPNPGTWQHIEIAKYDQSNAVTGWRIFIDGVRQTITGTQGSSCAYNYNIPDMVVDFTIGYSAFGYFNGKIDEFRYSLGICRHADTFTPPVAPYSIVNTLTELVTPYLTADLPQIKYAQNADVMWLVHPLRKPQKLLRTSATAFAITDVPFVRGPFLDNNITTTTITPSAATGGSITLTADNTDASLKNIFYATHVGSFWRINGGVVKITVYTNAYTVTGDVQAEPDGVAGNLGGTSAYTDWAEGAFSDYRGYPSAVCFHEQRLWYGGTTFEPNKFWGSVVATYDDFQTGVGDNYAVSFKLSTDQVNAIRWLVSNGSILQIGTSGGTFTADGSDGGIITSTNISVKSDNNYGVGVDQPKKISSYLYYLQRNLFQLRELVYNFQTDRQLSNDMNLLADHVLRDGSGAGEMDHQQSPNDRIWIIRDDGQIAVMTRNAEQEVLGWCRIKAGVDSTQAGVFESVCVIQKNEQDDQVWVIVKRYINGTVKRYIEYFTIEDFVDNWDPVRLDCSLTLDSPITVTGITKANPPVITAVAHGLVDGDQIKIDNVAGMTQLNGNSYLVAGSDAANTFHLHTLAGANVDASAYSTYISGGEVRKMVTAISGLSHLNGETIQVQTDGTVPATNSFVVSAGAITLASKAAVVHAGLPYTGTVQILKMSEGSAQGTGQTKTRRIYLSALRLFRSLGIGKIGQDADNCTEDINFGDPDTSAIYTGDIKKFFTTFWSDKAEVTIKVTQPLPVFLLACIFSSESEEN
jgi:hypothetical protein